MAHMNAADPRQIKKARQRERLAQQQELADLRIVLASPQGRRFLWRMLTAAGVFRLSFVSGDAESTAFNEGRRSLGLMLMADLHALDPELYVTMAREAADDEKAAPIDPPKPSADTEERD